MAKTKVNAGLYDSLSLSATAKLIAAVGDKVTILAQGEIGIGKSSMLKMLGAMDKFKDHVLCYFDITTCDLGDLMVPKIRTLNEIEVCSFIPNEGFGLHLGKPVIIMLDELGKASRSVRNAVMRLMLERKLGVYELPEGSIVFGTTNLQREGVGDTVEPHQRNRISVVKVRKPTKDEWIEDFALNYGVDAAVIQTVETIPAMLGSFEGLSAPDDNKYIFHPDTVRAAFCTPRSLEKASDIIKLGRAHGLDRDTVAHALVGCIGAPATYDMMACLDLTDKLPTWESILAQPLKTPIPESPAAVCMLIYNAIQNLQPQDPKTGAKDISSFLKYAKRLKTEQQALFLGLMLRNSGKAPHFATHNEAIEFGQSIGMYFGG